MLTGFRHSPSSRCLSPLSPSPLQPRGLFMTPSRQQERAHAVAFVLAPSSFFLEPASHSATGRPPSCHTAILLSPSCRCTLSPLPPALRFSSPQHLLASETPIHVSLPEAVKLYGIQGILCLTHCLISSTWTRTWHSVHIGGSGYLLNG